jgi:hypothetical protein
MEIVEWVISEIPKLKDILTARRGVYFAHAACKPARFYRLKLNKNLFAWRLTKSWVILFAPCAPSPQQAAHVCVAAIAMNARRRGAYHFSVGDAAMSRQNHHKARRVKS